MSRPLLPLVVLLLLAGSLPAQEGTLATTPAAVGASNGVAAEPHAFLAAIDPRRCPRRADLLAELRAAVRQRGDAALQAAITALQHDAAPALEAFTHSVELLGGRVTRRFWIVPAAAVELPAASTAAAVATLAAIDGAVIAEPDRVLEPHVFQSTSAAFSNADHVHQVLNLRGAGATLALVDSGIDADCGGTGRPHVAFDVAGSPGTTRICGTWSATTAPAEDQSGHGTQVAGMALAIDWNVQGTFARSDDGFAPAARVASYRVTNASGQATSSAMLAAWQQVLADRVRLDLGVANNSYSGDPSPTAIVQQAVDVLGWYGDVLIVTSAGNDGQKPSPCGSSQSNANGLAVGAVLQAQRQVAPFSSFGPLPGDGARFFPDLTALGQNIWSVLQDVPGGLAQGTGTSFAAPAVAGTALLLRGARRDLRALDAKALILNHVEDVAAANPDLGRQHYGLGFLRADFAAAALQQSVLLRGALRPPQLRLSFPLPVTASTRYAATLAWPRLDPNVTAWDDLDLEVRAADGRLVARSASPRNLYERVLFTATETAPWRLEIVAKTVLAAEVPFALAVGLDQGGGRQAGSYETFGASCLGSGDDPARGVIVPPGAATAFGNSSTQVPQAWYATHLQQVVQHDWLPGPGPWNVHRLALRRDEQQPGAPSYELDLEVFLGYTAKAANQLSTRYADNPLANTMVRVLADAHLDVPGTSGTAQGPGRFDFVLPLSAPFACHTAPGKNLLLDVTVYGHSRGAKPFPLRCDAVEGPAYGRLYSDNPFVTDGLRDDRYLVLSLMDAPLGPALPWLEADGVPQLGQELSIVLRQAPPGAATVLAHGWSESTWGTQALPFDLAAFGAPGCTVHVDLGTMLPLTVGRSGQGRVRYRVPADPRLTGLQFWNQFLVLDPAANALGLVTTNAGRALIGG